MIIFNYFMVLIIDFSFLIFIKKCNFILQLFKNNLKGKKFIY